MEVLNKEIVEFLRQYDMFDEEIEQCFMLCPGLDIVDKNKAEECLKILEKHGYPKEDLGLLLVVNPAILLYEPEDLLKKLESLDGDIEDILKDDPFAI